MMMFGAGNTAHREGDAAGHDGSLQEGVADPGVLLGPLGVRHGLLDAILTASFMAASMGASQATGGPERTTMGSSSSEAPSAVPTAVHLGPLVLSGGRMVIVRKPVAHTSVDGWQS